MASKEWSALGARLHHPRAGRASRRVTRCPLFRGKVIPTLTAIPDNIAALEQLCQHLEDPVLQFVLALRRAVSSQVKDDIAVVEAMIADPDPVLREVLEDAFWIKPNEPTAPAPA